jgi:hypothetical protein
MEKSYKTSKHTNKLHILHQNAKKNEFQQKKGSFCLLDTVNLQKKKNLTRTRMLTD